MRLNCALASKLPGSLLKRLIESVAADNKRFARETNTPGRCTRTAHLAGYPETRKQLTFRLRSHGHRLFAVYPLRAITALVCRDVRQLGRELPHGEDHVILHRVL